MSRIFIEKEQIEEINDFDVHEFFDEMDDFEVMTETEQKDWFGGQDDILFDL